jgi:hypothetical protein
MSEKRERQLANEGIRNSGVLEQLFVYARWDTVDSQPLVLVCAFIVWSVLLLTCELGKSPGFGQVFHDCRHEDDGRVLRAICERDIRLLRVYIGERTL